MIAHSRPVTLTSEDPTKLTQDQAARVQQHALHGCRSQSIKRPTATISATMHSVTELKGEVATQLRSNHQQPEADDHTPVSAGSAAPLVFGKRESGAWDATGQACLDLADGAGHDAFQHGAALIVQQVDLVDDDQAHQLRVGAVPALARDDVPLLRRGHDDLHSQGRPVSPVHVLTRGSPSSAMRNLPGQYFHFFQLHTCALARRGCQASADTLI